MSAIRRLPWWASLPVAALGGLALDAATPTTAWWPMSFVGAALILASVWHQRTGLGALAGALAGALFWMPQISWLTLYLGPVPWLGLSGVMIAWFALFGLAAALATRGLALIGLPRWALVAVQSLAVTGVWVLREQLQSTWPYGGFAWGRIAHAQAEGPLVHLVSWLGFTGLSAVLVLACAVPVACAAGAAGAA
ncbi:MAG: apolipoprotein N-acyltransferase, partial [Leucobacter sp.]|nr:apolipoprotein N-acyltransferase [Leucobacter sp.]